MSTLVERMDKTWAVKLYDRDGAWFAGADNTAIRLFSRYKPAVAAMKEYRDRGWQAEVVKVRVTVQEE